MLSFRSLPSRISHRTRVSSRALRGSIQIASRPSAARVEFERGTTASAKHSTPRLFRDDERKSNAILPAGRGNWVDFVAHAAHAALQHWTSNFQQNPDRPDQNIARTRNAMNRISTTVGGDAPSAQRSASAPNKNLYAIGEMPPLGHVPESMYAWVVRKDRHGPPEQSMQVEVVPTWPLDSHDVLVFVMAAGVNYNGVWGG